jgi:hypothetical protein
MENFRPNSDMNVGKGNFLILEFDAYKEYHSKVTITNCGRVLIIDKHLTSEAYNMKNIGSIVYKTLDTAQIINIKFKHPNVSVPIYCELKNDLFVEQYNELIDWWNKAL